MDNVVLDQPDRSDRTSLRSADSVMRPVLHESIAADTAALDAPPAAGKAPRRRRLFLILAAILIAVGIGGTVWALNRHLESTDDAFIDGDIVPLSPRIAGTVERIYIDDNQWVNAGDLLVELDPRDNQSALANAEAALESAIAQRTQAEANLRLVQRTTDATLQEAASGLAAVRSTLAQTQAQVEVAAAERSRAKSDADRYQQLTKEGFASRQRLEQAIAQAHASEASWLAAQQAARVAEARIAEAEGRLAQAQTAPQQIAVRKAQIEAATAEVDKARAAADQARLNLSYTRVYAPHSGHVTRKSVQVGDVVQRNQALAQIVFGEPWITANFKETQLTEMRSGQPVTIRIDAYPGVDFSGRVDSIQRGTGARFSLLPPENATGNFVKVVQRVPVKIVFDPVPSSTYVLGPGMSVVPTVRVGGGFAEIAAAQ